MLKALDELLVGVREHFLCAAAGSDRLHQSPVWTNDGHEVFVKPELESAVIKQQCGLNCHERRY